MIYNVVMNTGSPAGTSYRGCMDVTYKELVSIFGEPAHEDWDDCKAEWFGTIDGEVFTIYDRHELHNTKYTITDWHIGANDESVAKKVKDYVTQVILFS